MTDLRPSFHTCHSFHPRCHAEAVWLYYCFALSYRIVVGILAYRGISGTYKSVREWTEKFWRAYAGTIRRRMPRIGKKWHLDECVVSIKGEHHILWRVVDQHGFVLDVLVQKRRNTKAANVSCENSFWLLYCWCFNPKMEQFMKGMLADWRDFQRSSALPFAQPTGF